MSASIIGENNVALAPAAKEKKKVGVWRWSGIGNHAAPLLWHSAGFTGNALSYIRKFSYSCHFISILEPNI